jgi:hypothetical protein
MHTKFSVFAIALMLFGASLVNSPVQAESCRSHYDECIRIRVSNPHPYPISCERRLQNAQTLAKQGKAPFWLNGKGQMIACQF